MDPELSRVVFVLPNAKRMLVEASGIRIVDKQGNTIREFRNKGVPFDRCLTKSDRDLLSELRIAP
jgi:hypothetical protein